MSGTGPARSQRAGGPARGGRGLLAGWKLRGSRPPGTRVWRLPGPVIVWWAWVVFLAANLVDLVLSGRDWDSVIVLAVLALVTGVVYALAFRPRVMTDENGITVRNPFRDHWMPWGAVESVVVGESVQLHCSPPPGSDRGKVVHSWALYATRRSRIRHGERRGRRPVFQTPAPSNSKLPKEAQEMLKQSAVEHIAAEIDLQSRLAKQRGTADGAWSGSWPWLPAAAVLIPALGLAIVLLVR
jgi:hypothetical protein